MMVALFCYRNHTRTMIWEAGRMQQRARYTGACSGRPAPGSDVTIGMGGRGRSVQTCERYIILSHGVPKPLFTCISMSTYVKVGDNNINKRNVQMY